jgi:hypothetical protein
MIFVSDCSSFRTAMLLLIPEMGVLTASAVPREMKAGKMEVTGKAEEKVERRTVRRIMKVCENISCDLKESLMREEC